MKRICSIVLFSACCFLMSCADKSPSGSGAGPEDISPSYDADPQPIPRAGTTTTTITADTNATPANRQDTMRRQY